jgi:predicted amidophosphoribosyltransferase
MECPKCGMEISDNAMVCPNCKKVLKIICPVCRTVNEKNICNFKFVLKGKSYYVQEIKVE